MNELSRLIGARIRYVRKMRKLSQEQLGELAQLQGTYIGGVERGERNISLETLEKLINALRMTPPEFFYFGDNRTESETEKMQLIHTYISKLMRQDKADIQKIINVHNEIFND